MYFRIKTSGSRSYIQLVESRWEEGRSKQRVIATIGRYEQLLADGSFDRLLRSAARISQTALMISEYNKGGLDKVSSRKIGPPMIFERLWTETGCREVIESLLEDRRFQLPVERVIFLTVLHRLMKSGSDRHADHWRDGYRIEGIEDLQLHQVYRAMAWLGEELEDQTGGSENALRTTKDVIEERLFQRRRDLFTSLDIVFIDTTSIYFEGAGGQSLGEHGMSKDHRPDRKQMVVALVLDNEGRPVCTELWPGNTTDVKSLIPIVDRLRSKFSVHRVCVVADRGMTSKDTIQELEDRGWYYILGARMRAVKQIREDVLSRAGRYKVVQAKGQGRKSPLKVKEVEVEGRRYVICWNEDQAAKDAGDREQIVEALRSRLRKGDKSLIGNKGYRRYVKASGKRFTIDEDKIAAESRFDGKWVIRSNTDLSASEVALKYKQLWMVEDLIRTAKSILSTRPIHHRLDETIRGHVFCSFLALVLRHELLDRLATRNYELEWSRVLEDLDRLEEVELEQDGKRFLLRTATTGCSGKVFKAVGVRLPATVRQVPAAPTS